MAYPRLLTQVVNDPRLAESFTIKRTTGAFGPGGWYSAVTDVTSYGTIDNASGEDLEQIPEADRVTGIIVIHTEAQMYVTQTDPADGTQYLSDIVWWHNLKWRLLHVSDRSNRGYYSALAVRMEGN